MTRQVAQATRRRTLVAKTTKVALASEDATPANVARPRGWSGLAPDLTLAVVLVLKTKNPLNGSHGHWSKLAKVRKEQRLTVGLVVRSHIWAFPLAPMGITLTRLAPSPGLDFDGLTASLKSIRDGVTDALGLKDDSDPRLTWHYAQERSKTYGVRITISRKVPI